MFKKNINNEFIENKVLIINKWITNHLNGDCLNDSINDIEEYYFWFLIIYNYIDDVPQEFKSEEVALAIMDIAFFINDNKTIEIGMKLANKICVNNVG